jgi:hypothetical protein
MKVTFYGKLADMLGRELDLAVETPCTIARLRERIVAAFPPPSRCGTGACGPASAVPSSRTITRSRQRTKCNSLRRSRADEHHRDLLRAT